LGVLEVGSANVSVTGPSGVTGDVGIAPRGQLSVTGSSFVTGTVFLAANARYSKSGSGFVGSVVRNANLSQQISDALTAATNAAALTCSTSYRSLAPGLINGGPGLNVVCVQDIVINGGKVLTLNAPATASFVINVRGRFALTGGSKIRLAGGVSPENVLFNCIGTGEAVAFSGGVASATGASAVTGTLLAPEREVHLSPGYVQGSVISGMNINLTSGAKVTCSPSAPPLPPVVNIVTVTAISSFGPISNQCSATVECR
jgi:choice-of-anchor A domain-containing protein